MNPAVAVELTPASAVDYLANRKLHARRIIELAGGVSNTVLLVESEAGPFVLKQSLPQLRVEQQWLSDRSRIWREAAALELVGPHLPQGAVAKVLFRDDDNYLFAMTPAPAGSETWKSALLRGQCDSATATQIGTITAALMRSGWQNPAMEAAFGDITVFDQLRLDPYYRTTGSRHPTLAGFFTALSDTYKSRACTLVHGDWSPKNFLVGPGSTMAIDFEAIHFGDPAFDAGFLLNHLLLKSFHLPGRGAALAELAEAFWRALTAGMPPVPSFETRTIEHLGALLLARMDGKSPVEYIRDPDLKQRVRDFAYRLILTPPKTIRGVFDRCA